jgi:hypothetical protein
MKKRLALVILVGLLLIPSLSLRVQASGLQFGSTYKLGPGVDPNIQAVGSNVYVAWTDHSNGIFFKASSNDGQTWASPVKIGTGGNYPIMSANGNYVYVVWSAGGLLFTSSSSKGVSGSWLAKPIRVSSGTGAITPYIASDGQNVSVVYYINNVGSYVTSSTNAGKTWTTPYEFSNGAEPQVAMSGGNVYAIADNVDRSHALLAVSHDSGKTWVIDSLPAGSEEWIVATGSSVYAVWETKSAHSVVWFLSSSNYATTFNTQIISTPLGIYDAWNPMIDAIGSNVWVGIQEFGSHAQDWMLSSTNGGSTWNKQSLTTGVAGFIFSIPTTDSNNIFAMCIQGSTSTSQAIVGYSSNGGSSWATSSVGHSDPNADVAIGDIASDGAHGLATWQYNSTIYFAAS